MSLEMATNGLKEKIGEDCGLGATVKFDFGEDGVLFLDATQTPNVVSNDDNDAECTMVISMENFMEMAAGNLDGTSAFMTGKLKIQGDMYRDETLVQCYPRTNSADTLPMAKVSDYK